MITRKIDRILFCLLSITFMSASKAHGDLLEDLQLVECINRQVYYELPVFYNNLLYGGYINMPSARMGCVGEFGAGYAWVHPYHIYSLRFQYFSHLEGTFDYRVFKGIEDPILSPLGFGDRSDKGINLKFAIARPEDSNYLLPGIAVGIDDFIGSKAFCSRYIVATQIVPEYNLEASIGVGNRRIKGIFGGIMWMPFRSECYHPYLRNVALLMEYDAIRYHSKRFEPHEHGHKSFSKVNWGIKYRLFDFIDLSASYIRGYKFSFAGSAFYNFGETKGFIAKCDDPLPYRSPVVVEPIGELRPEEALVADIVYGFRDQCLDVRDISILTDECGDQILRISIMNWTYLFENDLRMRLNNLVAYLVPLNISKTIIVVNIEGFPVQEYHYTMDFARRYGAGQMCPYELAILTPLSEVTMTTCYCSRKMIYHKHHEYWNFQLLPKTNTFFGSAKGKFKYALGVNAALNGYLPYDIYYSCLVGVNIFSSLGDLGTVDRLNPSKLIQVRTDIIRYLKRTVNFEEAYLQKTWALGRGFYLRVAGGYFEIEYGGAGGEILYYPLNSCWAIGFEGAALMKRTYSGLGFTNKVRKTVTVTNPDTGLKENKTIHKHFHGAQYLLDIYYDWREMGLGFKVQTGKFLANDVGVRGEITRYFPSGVDITLWFTYTDGHDEINGSPYYDKGVMISMPLDFFYTYSSRKRWNYGMSAWLRDVGQLAYTGESLYQTIHDERR